MTTQEAGREGVSVADVLSRAADLIEPEGAWTQGDFARDETGFQYSDSGLTFHEFPATCFCLFGALAEVAEVSDPELYRDADRYLLTVVGVPFVNDVADWNDAKGRTQAEVVAKLREAAALAREQGL